MGAQGAWALEWLICDAADQAKGGGELQAAAVVAGVVCSVLGYREVERKGVQ